MKAVIVSAPHRIEVRDISAPQPGPFEALVRIDACGFCGTTDRHLIAGTQCYHPASAYPAVLGHESTGTVVSVGAEVQAFKAGDRVSRPITLWPGETRDGLQSAWGGFAEWGVVRDWQALVATGQTSYRDDFIARRQLVAPSGTDPLDAALAISLAEVASWLGKLGPLTGRSVVIGGTGFAATAAAVFARRAGARLIVVLGRRPEALERMRRAGADMLINLHDGSPRTAAFAATDGRGGNVFVEATGSDEVWRAGLATLGPGGVGAVYGAPDDLRYTLDMRAAPADFTARLCSPEEYLVYADVCRWLNSGEIAAGLFRTHTWEGLESIGTALAAQERGEVLKGVIRLAAG